MDEREIEGHTKSEPHKNKLSREQSRKLSHLSEAT